MQFAEVSQCLCPPGPSVDAEPRGRVRMEGRRGTKKPTLSSCSVKRQFVKSLGDCRSKPGLVRSIGGPRVSFGDYWRLVENKRPIRSRIEEDVVRGESDGLPVRDEIDTGPALDRGSRTRQSRASANRFRVDKQVARANPSGDRSGESRRARSHLPHPQPRVG